jgi:hypothetical protein
MKGDTRDFDGETTSVVIRLKLHLAVAELPVI